MEKLTKHFGPVVFTRTRKEALADGDQVEVTSAGSPHGFSVRVFATKGVVEEFQRLFKQRGVDLLLGKVAERVRLVREAGSQAATIRVFTYGFDVIAQMGPVDIDDSAPALTIMFPEEQ